MNPVRLLSGLLMAVTLPLAGQAQEKSPQPGSSPDAPDRREPRPTFQPPGGRADRQLKLIKVAWLGVATAPVDPAVRRHLDLPEGFGITVDYVAEDSPAAAAGVQEHDILVRLDDQRLTTPEHLAVLVRAQKKGDRVKLAFLRKGTEQTVEIMLGETEVPEQPEWPRAFGFQVQPVPGQDHQWQFQGQFPLPALPSGEKAEDWQRAMRDYQDRLKEWIERNHPKHFAPDQRPGREGEPGDKPRGRDNPPPPPGAEPAAQHPALPLPGPGSEKKPSGDKPPQVSVRPGFPIQVFSGSGMIRIDNQQGEVTIQVQDGRHTIKIVDADGGVIYEGDYDPEKGAEALPEKARDQLKKMKLDDLKVLGLPQPGSGEAGPKTEIKIEIESGQTPAASGKEAGKGDLL